MSELLRRPAEQLINGLSDVTQTSSAGSEDQFSIKEDVS